LEYHKLGENYNLIEKRSPKQIANLATIYVSNFEQSQGRTIVPLFHGKSNNLISRDGDEERFILIRGSMKKETRFRINIGTINYIKKNAFQKNLFLYLVSEMDEQPKLEIIKYSDLEKQDFFIEQKWILKTKYLSKNKKKEYVLDKI